MRRAKLDAASPPTKKKGLNMENKKRPLQQEAFFEVF